MGVGSAVPATAYVLGGPLAPLQIFGPIWRTWRGYHPELVVEEEEFHAAIERVVCVVDGDLIEREPGCVEREILTRAVGLDHQVERLMFEEVHSIQLHVFGDQLTAGHGAGLAIHFQITRTLEPLDEVFLRPAEPEARSGADHQAIFARAPLLLARCVVILEPGIDVVLQVGTHAAGAVARQRVVDAGFAGRIRMPDDQ